MKNKKHLIFISSVIRKKYIYQNNEKLCSFCNINSLSEIIAKKDKFVLLKNKFITLEDTFQTVLVETNNCFSNMNTYSKKYMRKLISFGIDQWIKMENTHKYKSVVFYKNYGNLSGGSMSHSHMQIIGLKNIDYKEYLSKDIFEGIKIYEEKQCSLNISTKPNACAIEFNIITPYRNDYFMADNIQKTIKYIINQIKCDSFNLFFYHWDDNIICKVSPRYITSPFFIGYSIPQISNELTNIALDFKKVNNY